MIIQNKANLSEIEAAVLSDYFSNKQGFKTVKVCSWDYEKAAYVFTATDFNGKETRTQIPEKDIPNIRREQLRVTENFKRNGQDLQAARDPRAIPDPETTPLERINRAIKQLPEVKKHGDYYWQGIKEELRRAKIQLEDMPELPGINTPQDEGLNRMP